MLNKKLSQGNGMESILYLNDKMRERGYKMRETGMKWEMGSDKKEKGRLMRSEGNK